MSDKSNNLRNGGLDLLKIVAIIFVIILHYNNPTMGGLLSIVKKGTANYFIVHLTEALSIVACNVFVIITGYYLCKDDKIKVRKIFDIILLLLFYGIIIYVFAILTDLCTFDIDSIKQLLVSINSRWFIDIYILLYLLHPFINKIINSITKRQFIALIIICILFFYGWHSLIIPKDIVNTNIFINDSGYGIINFITLYLLGAYIRIYYDKKTYDKKKLIIVYVVLGLINTFLSYNYSQVYHYNFITNLINTICLFLIFKNLNIKSKIISTIASTSLAVYIIHENQFIVKYIYQTIFKSLDYGNNNFMILHMLVTCLLIFAFCVIIELIRKYIFKITINKCTRNNKTINKIMNI